MIIPTPVSLNSYGIWPHSRKKNVGYGWHVSEKERKSRNLGWGIFMATYWRRGQVFLIGGPALKWESVRPISSYYYRGFKKFWGGQGITCLRPCTCTTQTHDFSIPTSFDSNKLCHATLSYADVSSWKEILPPICSISEAPIFQAWYLVACIQALAPTLMKTPRTPS